MGSCCTPLQRSINPRIQQPRPEYILQPHHHQENYNPQHVTIIHHPRQIQPQKEMMSRPQKGSVHSSGRQTLLSNSLGSSNLTYMNTFDYRNSVKPPSLIQNDSQIQRLNNGRLQEFYSPHLNKQELMDMRHSK